ncbi:MAG: hypothetical protein Q9176_004779 [Flavoplaca citrina]
MAARSAIINDDSTLTNGNGPLSNSIGKEHRGVKTNPEPTPIAIIGMACRTPGKVSSPEDLWELCSQRRSGWSKVPRSRFNHEAFYHPNPSKAGCMNPQGAHFLQNDLSHFDSSFFRITDKEASSIDPQQRIMLECAYEAIENALHLACQSLRAGESSMAIAGGCHVNLTPDDFISFSMSK